MKIRNGNLLLRKRIPVFERKKADISIFLKKIKKFENSACIIG